MDDTEMADDQSDQVDSLKRKRVHADEDTDASGQAVQMGSVAVKATGKPVLNTKALRSVLKVFVVQAVPNYAQPWQMRPQRSSSGSAFVTDTEKRHIMTNSHVISNSTTVHVRRPGNPKKWRARLLCEGIICDLALLTVDEEEFWSEDLMSLQFVDVPELQDSILVAGYPMGGDSLSITKGIVSRVVMTRYAHASNKLLGIQIDAAINPGNSGGPAFLDLQQGKVAGVAFSKLSQADNVGYIIPWKIVAHFLREYNQHGSFRGCCSVGFRWQDMENAHMRDHYKLPPNGSGSLVFKIDPLAPAADTLEVNDVVLEIEGVPIADDGTVEFRNEERVEFSHIVRSKHIGDWLNALVLRDGKQMSVKYQLNLRRPLVPVLAGVDCVPSYFIVGGLVFVPLSIPFLEHAYGGNQWRKHAPVQILALVAEYRERMEEQVVVLFQVLAAEINFGYKFQTVRCEAFNGQEVRNLATFAELVDGCTDKYMKFGLEGGKLVILDRLQANEDAPRILQQHAITFDRSADLRALKEEKTGKQGFTAAAPGTAEQSVTANGTSPAL
ncbi:g1127 [Coccomyxa viridis]|uniref:G1127 protein n=1 Tax=Coccomyxa viridis TaxID=1274662 RepID=A0ABP1FHB3_9CHLO